MYTYKKNKNGESGLWSLTKRIVQIGLFLRSGEAALFLDDEDIAEFSEAVQKTGLQIPLNHIPSIMIEFQALTEDESQDYKEMPRDKFEAFLFTAALLSRPEGRELNRQSDGKLKDILLNTRAPKFDRPLITTYGVETEFYGLNRAQARLLKHAIKGFDPSWQKDWDASIQPDDGTEGIELISPVMDEDNINRLYLFSALLSLMGGKAPFPCALHAHAGLTNTFNDVDFRQNLMKQIVINYAAVEKHLDFLSTDLVKSYSEAFAPFESFASAVSAANLETKGTFPQSQNHHRGTLLQPHGRRQSKVNFQPYYVYGTAEFREHPGTVDPQEIFGWLNFVNNMIGLSVDMVRTGLPRAPSDSEMQQLQNMASKLEKTFTPRSEEERTQKLEPDGADYIYAAGRAYRRPTSLAIMATLALLAI